MIVRVYIISILVTWGLPTFGQDKDPIRREINQIIKYETTINYKQTPGFIVGMIDNDTSFIFPFGSRSLHDKTLLAKDDIFEIGGITKIFTALLLEKMKKEYQIDFNASINNYLPVKNPSFENCTIDRLLTHTSGLPKLPPGWGLVEKDAQDPYANFTQQDLEDFYQSYDLKPTPANQFLYSHLNYVMLEWIIENITHLSYNEVFDKYFSGNFIMNTTRLPTVPGYNRNMTEIKPWSSIAFGGSIGLKSSLDELMKAAYYFLYSNDTAFKDLLAIKEVIIRKEKGFTGIGFQVIPVAKDRNMYFHTGRTDGHYAFIALAPETHTAVVILANSATGADILGTSILRMMNKSWRRKS